MENSVFIPFNTDHALTVIGEVITSSGGSGVDAFDRTPLSAGTEVDINYIPPQVEIIYINTGSGVTAQDIINIAVQVTAQARITPINSNVVLINGITASGLGNVVGNVSLTNVQNDKLMSLGTPTEIVTTLMETPIPVAPAVNTFGDLIKNKILTVFRFNAYK